jgi:Ca-activated chloride channel family protein
MRYTSNIAEALHWSAQSNVFQIKALKASMYVAAFSLTAWAQATETGCSNGAMRASEAGTGMLLLRTRTPGCYLPAPRVAADINVDVSGPVARTHVTQRFENPADGWVEGVYVFPLPENAAVDTLKLVIGDRFIEGQVKERQEARRIYDTAKAQGVKASLVEQERPNIFTNQVANIGPHETVVVQIEYQQRLQFDQGQYHLRVPLVVAPRYSPAAPSGLIAVGSGGVVTRIADPVPDRDRLSAPVIRPEAGTTNPVTLAVHLATGFPLGAITSDSHPIGVTRQGRSGAIVTPGDGDIPADRDFTLTLAPVAGAMPDVSILKERMGDSDYVLALVMPPSAGARTQKLPREVIFVLDNSGSMGGESIRQAKAGLLEGLARLTPADRFNVIRFDDTLTVFFPAPVAATPENVARARAYVSSIEARGGTEMLPALLAALKDATPEATGRLRQVIFLTDGSVGNEAQLFSAISERLGRSRLYTIGIGSAPNSYFMSGAARAGRGTFTYIGSTDQVTSRMSELFAKLEHPVMTNLVAQWPNAVQGEAWPNPLPDLYTGEPILITLKTPDAKGQWTLTGDLDGKPWRTTLDLSRAQAASGIEKLWARTKITALEDSRVRGADPGDVDKAVLAVALDHHLTSRLTSLVAIDITPSRAVGETLTSAQVPLNLPKGWDFGKVFGGRARPLMRRADSVPSSLFVQQRDGASGAAVAPEDAGLVLPQGGTDARMLMLAGLALLLVSGALLLRSRHG